MSDELYSAGCFIHVGKRYIETLWLKIAPQPLGPLDQTDTFTVKILLEAELCRIVAAKAIEVEVVEHEPSRVFIQDGERRAGDGKRRIDAESSRYPPGKLGLAAPELAGERDESSGTEQSAKPRSESSRFFNAMSEKRDQLPISPSSGSGQCGK